VTEPTEPTEPLEQSEPPEQRDDPGADLTLTPEEQEQADQDEQGDDAAPSEDAPAPEGKSQKEIEKGLRALEREAQRHAKRVAEIMEEDAQHLVLCELCAPLIPGFRWPQVPEDQRAAVMLAIGFDPKPDLLTDKRAHACPDCNGYGLVATGSKVQGQDALACIDCGGSGWVGERRNAPATAVTPPMPAAPSNGPQPEVPLSPDREAAKQAAQAAGFMVIDTQTPAAV